MFRRKFKFYETYGVEEYYVYDPDTDRLQGWQRQDNQLVEIPYLNNWVSPRLQIRFDTTQSELVIYRPDGQRFLSPIELEKRAKQAEQQLEDLLATLRERGIDPNAL